MDRTVELANLEADNARRLADLMDGKTTGIKTSLPKGFIEQMQVQIFVGHIARTLGVELDAKLDFNENLAEIISDIEGPSGRDRLA